MRGAAVVLVVFNHAVIFATDTYPSPPDAAVWLNGIFAPIRMPLMVFLSGLMLSKSLAKPAGTYMVGKLKAILYPFVVWVAIILGYEIVTDYLRGRDFTVPSAWSILVHSPGHTWFLLYLFVYYVVALVFSWVPAWTVATAALILAALPSEGDIDRFLMLFVYFVLGYYMARNRELLSRMTRTTGIVVALGAATLALTTMSVTGVPIRHMYWTAPLVAGAIIFCVFLGRNLQDRPGTRILEFGGRRSLVFYLAHWFPTLFGVIAAAAVLPESPYAAVASGLAVGIAVPLALAWLYDRTPIVRAFFVWPFRARAVATAN